MLLAISPHASMAQALSFGSAHHAGSYMLVLARPVAAAATHQRPAPMIATPPASDCVPSQNELKRLALETRKAHPDTVDFLRALDTAVGADSEYFNAHLGVSLSDSSLGAWLVFPYAAYRLALFEALRKREPIDDVAAAPGVAISVSPTRIDAPDIVKVVVERDGKERESVINLLKPTTMETRSGGKAVLHTGAVFYPCAAFAPGALVHIELIPERGANIVRDTRPSELAVFSMQHPEVLASALLKLTAADVESRIGKPLRIDGRRWVFRAIGGENLIVYLSDSNVVVDVQPKTFDISLFKTSQ
jgi:hypothetical protein